MSNTFWNPLVYLAPPEPSFWRWSDDCRAVTWWSEDARATMAFRPELDRAFSCLKPGGLPPLSLILLLLAACRDSWASALEDPNNTAQLIQTLVGVDKADQQQLLAELTRIASLPADVRHPIEGKVGLIRACFEAGDCCTPESNAKAIRDVLLRSGPSLRHSLRSSPVSEHGLVAGVARLLEALARIDEESLRLRQTTGLEQLLLPADTELPLDSRARDLISRLEGDQWFRGFARIVHKLIPVVRLPRALSLLKDLPVGGFSDLANRGSLDRLLVSELAQDDLTLAVRIVLNEALYLRRESPPKTALPSRSILIDTGIRQWGVPRVFATAVAMALTVTTDRHANLSVFRAEGERIATVDLTTRRGLVRHMEALPTAAHPGKALDSFLAKTRAISANVDTVIITSAEAMRDREFQKALGQHQQASLYLATVGRDGVFQLLRQTAHAQKVICEARLNLDDLLKSRGRPTMHLVNHDTSHELPAVMYQQPFPLRVPPTDMQNVPRWMLGLPVWMVWEKGILEISNDQRLLFWDKRNSGPREIVGCLHCKAVLVWGSSKIRNGQAVAVIRKQVDNKLHVLRVDMSSDRVQLEPLELAHQDYSICGDGEVIFAISNEAIWGLSAVDGRCLGVFRLSVGQATTSVWRHSVGRFFYNKATGAWYAISYNGQEVQMEKITDSIVQGGRVVEVWDWSGHEGPVGLTKHGVLYFPEDGQCRRLNAKIQGPVVLNRVSPCGQWIELFDEGIGRRCVDVRSGEIRTDDLVRIVRSQWATQFEGHLHCRFVAVLASESIGLALLSRKGVCWRFLLGSRGIQLRPDSAMAEEFQRATYERKHRISRSHGGYQLKRFVWEDGSRAWLDSRGLLHLRSADIRIPEVSIVLADGYVGGWRSDGNCWGNRYFCGHEADHVRDGAESVFHEVILPYIEHLS